MNRNVVAGNIFRLRTIAGLNQKEAAEKAGLSRPAFASIEKGQADPRTETLHKIADAFNVPVREFFTDMPELKSVRFRMSKITEQKRKLREQEIINITRWLKNYNYLEDVLDKKLVYKFSSFKIKDPVQLAQKVRSELKLSENEPINGIAEIINRAGVKIHFSNLPIDQFFGLSVGFEDGGPAISVNIADNISIERQIFTAAHELGHLLMHKESFKSDVMEDDKNEELDANVFASYFLMPDRAFKNEIEKNNGLKWVDLVLHVKHYFKVSYKTVLMRLIDLQMVGKTVYQDFAVAHKKMYGGSLKDHFAPCAEKEPLCVNNGTIGNRLFQLVREALEKDLISLSKAAEILNKSNEEMRDLSNSWEQINWNVLKNK